MASNLQGSYQCSIICRKTSQTLSSTASNIILDGQEPKILRTNFDRNEGAVNSWVEGDNISIQVYYTGNPLPNVSWLLDHEQLPPAAHNQSPSQINGEACYVSTVYLDAAFTDDSGNYICNLRNRLGVKQVQTILEVKADPKKQQQIQENLNNNLNDIIEEQIDEVAESMTDDIAHERIEEALRVQHEKELEEQENERRRRQEEEEKEHQRRVEIEEQKRLEQMEMMKKEKEALQAQIIEEKKRQEMEQQKRLEEEQNRLRMDEERRNEELKAEEAEQQRLSKVSQPYSSTPNTTQTNIESIENLMPGQGNRVVQTNIAKITKITNNFQNDSLQNIPENHEIQVNGQTDNLQDSAIGIDRSMENIKTSMRVTEIPSDLAPPIQHQIAVDDLDISLPVEIESQDQHQNQNQQQQPLKPTLLKELIDQSVPDSCQTFQWELILAAYPPPNLKWFFNNEEIAITGAEDEPFETYSEEILDHNDEYYQPDVPTFRFIFKLKEVFPEDAGYWMVMATNESGTVQSKASLYVKDVQGYEPRIIIRANDVYYAEANINQPLQINFKIDGEPVPNLLYSVNGSEHLPAHLVNKNNNRYFESDVEMDDGIEFTLTIKDVMPEDFGDWCVLMKNYHGEVMFRFLIADAASRIASRQESSVATNNSNNNQHIMNNPEQNLMHAPLPTIQRSSHFGTMAEVKKFHQHSSDQDQNDDGGESVTETGGKENDQTETEGEEDDSLAAHLANISSMNMRRKNEIQVVSPEIQSDETIANAANKTKIGLTMDMLMSETETERTTNKDSDSDTSTLNGEQQFDYRQTATNTLDAQAQIDQNTGQLDFRNVLGKKSAQPIQDHSQKSDSNKLQQLDFRSNLKGNKTLAGNNVRQVNLERELDNNPTQLDFRSMLKNKTNTKTLTEDQKRTIGAEQIDFRSQLRK